MDVWARKQDMNTKRAIHALAGMNDRLYAIGGNHLKGKHSSFSDNEQKAGQDWYFFEKYMWKSCCHFEQAVTLITLCNTVASISRTL